MDLYDSPDFCAICARGLFYPQDDGHRTCESCRTHVCPVVDEDTIVRQNSSLYGDAPRPRPQSRDA